MKKCLIFFVLLFVVLFAVNVSGAIIYYNYSDISYPSNSQKAFYGNTSGIGKCPTLDKDTLVVGTEDEFGSGWYSASNKYVNLTLSDNYRAFYNHTDCVYHRFVSLINESTSSINNLTITWEGTGGGGTIYLWNHTLSKWGTIGVVPGTEDNFTISYAEGFNDYINSSGNLVFLVYMTAGFGPVFSATQTDFVQFIVDNTSALAISNVQTHSGIFSYGVSWDTNLNANGSLNITNSSGFKYYQQDKSFSTTHTIFNTGSETLPASFIINITSCTSAGACATSLNHNATMFGDGAGQDPISQLNITLISPLNSTNTTNKNNTFSFNASTSPFILYNASIYTNESGTWKSNYSIQINGTFNSSSFFLNNTKDGKFKWNVYACDIDRQCNYSRNNWTFTVDTQRINLTLNNPISFYNSTSAEVIFNVSVADKNVKNVSLYGNFSGTFTINTTNSSGITDDYLFNLTIASGTYLWGVKACDSSGNCNMSNRTLTVDTTTVALTLTNPTSFYNSSRAKIEFNATISNGNLKNVSLYGNWSGSFTINQTNTSGVNDDYSFTVNLSDGRYFWGMKACDFGGLCNMSNRTFTVDTTIPNVSLVYPTNNSINTLPSKQVNFTFNTSDLTIGVKNCSLWLSNVNNTALIKNATDTSITVDVNQTFNVSKLKGGEYKWLVECTDYVNNKDNSSIRNFTLTGVDNLVPSLVSLISPSDYLNSSNNSITFNISAENDNLQNISIFTNTTGSWIRNLTIGRTGTANSSNFSITNIKDGIYLWGGKACDIAGNCNVSINRTFTIDTTSPAINLVYPRNTSNFSFTGINFTYNVSEKNLVDNCSLWLSNADSVVLIKNGTDTGISKDVNQSFNVTNLKNGEYNWLVECTDNVNNKGNSSKFNLTIDTVAPNISAVTITKSCNSVTAVWTTNEISNSSLNYGTTTGLGSVTGSNALVSSHSLSVSSLVEGTRYYFNVSSCDPSNNCNVSSGSFLTGTNCQGGGGGGGGKGGGSDPDPDPEPEPVPELPPIPPFIPGVPVVPIIPPDIPINPEVKNLVTGFFEKGFFSKEIVKISSSYECGGIVLSLGEVADIQLNLERDGRFVIPRLFFNVGEKRDFCAWCYDGIKNYDEVDVDCGGSCIDCSESKSCYDKPLIGIIVILFLLLFVNSLYLIENYDNKNFKFGLLLMGVILVLSLVFSWIYFCYSYNWIYGLLVIFVIFYVIIYNNEFGFSKKWKIKRRKYSRYDDMYNYDEVKKEFDELNEIIRRDIRYRRFVKARDKFEKLLGVYSKLKKYLSYKENVNLHYKLGRLRNRIEMKMLVEKSKEKVRKYKVKKVKVKKFKKRKINLTALSDRISKVKGKFRKVFKRDKELEKLKKKVYK